MSKMLVRHNWKEKETLKILKEKDDYIKKLEKKIKRL